MKHTPRIAAPKDVYAYYIDELGKYGTCQILSVNQDSQSLCYVTLDYLEETPPTAEQLETMKPYYLQAFRHHHSITKSCINNTTVPRNYIYIGQCELKADIRCSSFSASWPTGSDYYFEERWRSFDENARIAYKKFCNSGVSVQIHGQTFRKNIGCLEEQLYQCLTEADTLEAFPCITSAKVTGYSGKLEKWLHDTPLLSSLCLKKAGVETLDLGNTHLEHLELNLSGIQRLVLPKQLIYLQLYGEAHSKLRIDNSLCTGKMNLYFSMKHIPVQRYGLQHTQLKALSITDISVLDAQSMVNSFSDIEWLQLTGKPGTLTNISALRQLQHLKGICLQDLFGYTALDMEFLSDLPALCELDFDSIPREAGVYLKKTWKGKLDKLTVSHLRNEGWLKENLENPLRHWDGNEEFIPQAAYKSAVKCYKETKKQMQTANTKSALEDIIRQYTIHFNRLNQKYDEFIETMERDDIYMAMQQLYEECVLHGTCGETDETNALLTLEEAWDIMDEVRDDW